MHTTAAVATHHGCLCLHRQQLIIIKVVKATKATATTTCIVSSVGV
jgi:hypothetical protein